MRKFPNRNSFNKYELDAVKKVFDYYSESSSDICYQGYFERKYCSRFVNFLGIKGYADAVNSGTNALFIAIASLQLKKGSHVLVSPVTDPGTLNAIILNNLIPVVIDSMANSYNIDVNSVKDRVTQKTTAIIVVHLGGAASEIDKIVEFCEIKNIKVIEDCSQAHGTQYKNKKVGTFGDIAVFSTMFSKNHSTGGTGGIVFTSSYDLYKKVRAYADRGKDFFNKTFDGKDPNSFLFPALNCNLDEISCAIGIVSLKKLPKVNKKRVQIIKDIDTLLVNSKLFKIYKIDKSDAPFFWPIEFKIQLSQKIKDEILRKIQHVIPVNPKYNFIITEWEWTKQYLNDTFIPNNAIMFRNNSFNLLFNEKFKKRDITFIVNTLLKIEKEYINEM